jgi:hypothetical protein
MHSSNTLQLEQPTESDADVFRLEIKALYEADAMHAELLSPD